MTELLWDGKYDKDGKRVAPVRIPLPFQTVETVNESGQARAHQLDLFAAGRPPRLAQPPHLGRQEIRPPLAAARPRRPGQPDLH